MTTLKAIFATIKGFVQAHAVASIATASVVAVTAVAVPVTVHVVNEQKQAENAPYTEPFVQELDDKYEQQAKEEQEAGLPSQAEQEAAAKAEAEAQAKAEAEKKAAEEAAKAEAEKKAQEEAAKQEAEKVEPAPKPVDPPVESTPAPQPAPEKVEKPAPSTPQVVQMANPDTGISWDGKSPIVYTYPDGTTGTVPKDGATYEVEPGFKGTYTAPKEDTVVEKDDDGSCEHCGRKSGDGANGTCLRFWAFDDNCPHCGEFVAVNTCHTCG